MKKDLWHFPRTDLAGKVIGMFDMGLSSALTFFAPRRMGKTEFLRKDIMPLAEQRGWSVHYFSFLDAEADPRAKYEKALFQFAHESGAIKQGHLKSRVKKLKGAVVGLSAEIEIEHAGSHQAVHEFSDLIKRIGSHNQTILLLDEVQALAGHRVNDQFVASLRTALDTNKDTVKVIFTGSSREKLTHMFSKASAPFFHFGQNLDFPAMGKEFTDHLSDVYQQITHKKLDKTSLWQAFQDMDNVPQLIRSLVERLALNPNLEIEDGKEHLLDDLYQDRSYAEIWSQLSQLEKLILQEILLGESGLYAEKTLEKLSLELGVKTIKNSSIQSALRALTRKDIIIKSVISDRYVIDDPNFCSWLGSLK